MAKKSTAGVAMALGFVSLALAAEIADIAWNESNIERLRAFDKAAVARLVADVTGNISGHWPPEVKPRDVGEFTWADLAGDGHYELVTTLDVNGRAFFNALMIYSRDSSGKVNSREIRGWLIGDLNGVVRDLDGDGKQELVIPTELSSRGWSPTAATPTWSAVYRLKDGKYVEASRDFPDFYDKEVLPKLQDQIAEREKQAALQVGERESGEAFLEQHAWGGAYKQLAAEQSAAVYNYEGLAVRQMTRAKILRTLGRDPRAGEQEAREWMKSSDPQLRQCAAAVFRDMGGHEAELRVLDGGN